MMMPLLEGTDGIKKMSKSYNNVIGIHDVPSEMFGKIMSISDALMWRYFELLSDRLLADIQALKKSVELGENPRNIKLLLAEELVSRFHDAAEATQAKQQFIDQFSRGNLPQDIPEFAMTAERQAMPLVNFLKEIGLVESTSAGHRLLRQGAIKLDGTKTFDNPVMANSRLYK